MAPRLKLSLVNKTRGTIGAIFEGMYRPVASACTGAIKRAGEAVKTKGRASIAGEGMSRKWQNALRVKYYPANLVKATIDAAAFIYHKIDYSAVFDKPTAISPGKLMWIPLSETMGSIKKQRSPAALRAAGVELFSMVGAKTPMLGARIKGAARNAGKQQKVSLAKLKRGVSGKRGVEQTVPLFVGIPSVRLRKQFGIERITREEAANLPAYYESELKPDNRD